MKRLVVLAFIAILVGVLTMGCEKETIKEVMGPTEYDSTIVYDTTIVVDTTVGAYAAIVAVHEDWGTYGVVEFMPFSSIPTACAQVGWDASLFGVTQIAPNQWRVTGIVYLWDDPSGNGPYYMHTDNATYLGGNPNVQSSWSITDPSAKVTAKTISVPIRMSPLNPSIKR